MAPTHPTRNFTKTLASDEKRTMASRDLVAVCLHADELEVGQAEAGVCVVAPIACLHKLLPRLPRLRVLLRLKVQLACGALHSTLIRNCQKCISVVQYIMKLADGKPLADSFPL